MQSSYDMVKRAIEFGGPERVPYNFDGNRTPAIDARYGEDFLWVFVDPAPEFAPRHPGENELGVIYETLDKTFGKPINAPLADWKKLAEYKLPDYTEPSRYKNMEREIKENPGKYVLGMWPHFLFMTMLDLLGFEKLMFDLFDQRANIEKVIDMLTESCLKVVDCMADRGVHGIIAIEDLGEQSNLIINPRAWRQLYKPSYAKIIEKAHSRGLHVHIHCCGQILDLIEDFIEIGMDVVQLDQQDNMGIENLSKRYKGRICFFCPVDIQTVLSRPGNFVAIEQKVKDLISAFSTADGGFMAKAYPQPEAIDLPEENTAYMCEMFRKYGVYPLVL